MNKTSLIYNNTVKGIFLIVSGILLFLYTLGVIERGINVIIMIIALVMVIFGAFKLNLIKGVSNILHTDDSKEDKLHK